MREITLIYKVELSKRVGTPMFKVYSSDYYELLPTKYYSIEELSILKDTTSKTWINGVTVISDV